MDFCTSTPLVVAKQNSSRINNDNKLNQKLFINNADQNNNDNNNNNNNTFFDEYWEKINGPKFVDFANGIPEPRDSFFDGRQSICPTPVKNEDFLQFNNNDLINTLENFSLGSENDDDVEDITLKADATLFELTTNETSVINCGDKSIDRRLSRLLTTPQPFSFESRERDKQDRKLAKKQFLQTNAHEKQTGFKARPAPKFKNPIKNPIKQIKKEEKRPVREEVPVVKNEVKAQEFFNWKKETKPFVCKGSIKEEVISPINLSPVGKVDKSVSCTVEELESELSLQARDDGSAGAKHRKKIEVWNQKPFQVNLPKRRILVPKSPKLRTAERARERKLFEEKLKKREKDFEEFHKILSETQREKEKDEIARLRQQATFKARPMPKYPDVKVSVPFKRQLVNPPIPQISKRPRRNEN